MLFFHKIPYYCKDLYSIQTKLSPYSKSIIFLDCPLTLLCEVEQRRKLAPVRQLLVALPQLVEERVRAGLNGGDPGARGVLEQPGHEGDRVRRGACPEYLNGERDLRLENFH